MKAWIVWTVTLSAVLASAAAAAVAIESAPGASAVERLAALEVQRYVYLRTGELPIIGKADSASLRIVVARKDRRMVGALRVVVNLAPEQYILRTTSLNGTTS
jgi:hypothetical protein